MLHIVLPLALIAVTRGENVNTVSGKVILSEFAFLKDTVLRGSDKTTKHMTKPHVDTAIVQVVRAHAALLSVLVFSFIP